MQKQYKGSNEGGTWPQQNGNEAKMRQQKAAYRRQTPSIKHQCGVNEAEMWQQVTSRTHLTQSGSRVPRMCRVNANRSI